MKWIIKNPAPANKRMKSWGDYHFGLALATSLKKLGHDVEMDCFGKWYDKKNADIILVLRGDHEYRRASKDFSILWIYSHPESVSIDECIQYDLICVCSQIHADWIKGKLDRPVAVMPQCVDTTRFYLEDSKSMNSKDIIFVGNTRITKRNCIIWAIEAGLDVKIWGRGWEEFVDPSYIVAQGIDNRLLPNLYRNSKLTLNDHFLDMRKWGYINNRVFDALACGLPVLSDQVTGLENMFVNAILTFRDKTEFYICLERYFMQYPYIRAEAKKHAKIIAEQHSFDYRAKVFSDYAIEYL